MEPIFGVKTEEFELLKGKIFAEYSIEYHINDCFSVKNLNGFYSKHQLLFQKFSSRVQQMNLVLIDSYFPLILAHVALEAFFNKVNSFREFVKSNRSVISIDNVNDEDYLTFKFTNYIHQLLYSEISSKKVCKGELNTKKVYCLKNSFGELEFYSIFEHNKLKDLLFDKLKIEIDLLKSSVSGQNVKLNFIVYLFR